MLPRWPAVTLHTHTHAHERKPTHAYILNQSRSGCASIAARSTRPRRGSLVGWASVCTAEFFLAVTNRHGDISHLFLYLCCVSVGPVRGVVFLAKVAPHLHICLYCCTIPTTTKNNNLQPFVAVQSVPRQNTSTISKCKTLILQMYKYHTHTHKHTTIPHNSNVNDSDL